MGDVIAPERGAAFVDQRGAPLPRPMRWIEEVSRIVNTNNTSITDRLDELEPQYVVITNAESPYAASNNDYILCDMSTGNIDVTLPASGRLHVSREGSTNTLTLIGTVNGVANPTIVATGDAPALAFIGTEFRYV